MTPIHIIMLYVGLVTGLAITVGFISIYMEKRNKKQSLGDVKQ